MAEALLGYDGVNQVKIISANGWSCSGAYDKKQFVGSVARSFPISCTNGARGNAVMSINSTQQRAAVAFKLNNGTSGKVAFGIVS